MGNKNLLFESIFNRPLSSDDTVDYLAKITREHPYFTPAQFFLLLKANKDSSVYKQLVAKTSVLFNNPYWLQFQLNEKASAYGRDEKSAVAGWGKARVSYTSPGSDLPAEEPLRTAPVVLDEPRVRENEEDIAEEVALISPQSEQDTNDQQATVDETYGEVSDEPPPAIKEGSQDPEQIPVLTEEPVPPLAETIGEQIEVQDDSFASLQEDNAGTADPVSVLAPGDELPVTDPEENDIESPETVPSVDLPEPGAATEDKVETPEMSHQEPLVNDPELENEPLPETGDAPVNFKLHLETPTTTEDTIHFEPLHASDYFASQGIKLSGEIKPTDRLGRQLKSFTEWLKTMKKLHTEQLPQLSPQADLSIQQLAEKSNSNDGVLTEAMADVLLKQGKTVKAIEVYRKLSLLDPSKSAYFAAKIDQLKEN